MNIRRFVETVLPRGSLGIPEPQGQAAAVGAEIHRTYQKRGIQGYKAEVSLERHFESSGVILQLSGKADGIYNRGDKVVIEEIKTTRKPLEELLTGEEVHWAQLKLYTWFYYLEHAPGPMEMELIYFSRTKKAEKKFTTPVNPEKLEKECQSWILPFLEKQNRLRELRLEANRELTLLSFPFSGFRKGQRALAKTVYRSVRDKKILFVQAPTGTGKTMGVLFPALKALGEDKMEKLFYLTAKNAGIEAVEKALELLGTKHLKWITITAKSKICFLTQKPGERPPCDPELCSYARDYYTKLPGALEILFQCSAFSRKKVESTARQKEVCPFELSLDLALSCDLIIGDFNYVFDPTARLKRFFLTHKNPYTLLVDEAHNLPDRSRMMFSAVLDKKEILAFRRLTTGKAKKALSRFNSYLLELKKTVPSGTRVSREKIPEKLIEEAAACLASLDEALEKEGPFPAEGVEFYLTLRQLARVAGEFDSSYRCLLETTKNNISLNLFCIDPSGQLQKVLKELQGAVFFSATLTPAQYLISLIAPDLEPEYLALPSPFPEENCRRILYTHISTRYRDREKNKEHYASLCREVMAEEKGNLLFFSPSFAFQEALLEELGFSPEEEDRILIQTREMKPEKKEEFTGTFHKVSSGLRGFCVLGGSFSESIDLEGEKLVGVVIFGTGLPQVNFTNDAIKDYFQEKYGAGFAFAYVFPGFNKVIQAAGRVIRSENDRGFIYFVDDRYRDEGLKSLFPPDWNLEFYPSNGIRR